MSVDLKGIIDWLRGWFYDKTEVTGFLNNKANVSDLQTTNSNLSALQSTVNNKVDKVTGKGLSEADFTSAEKSKLANIEAEANKYVHPSTHSSNIITESSALSNIGTSANATQHTINTAIDTKIGDLSSIKAIEVVSTLPTASSSTMGKLYIVSEDSKVNVYYTEQGETSSSFSWHKMDTDILDELSINWSDILNKPSTFPPNTHTHEGEEIIVSYNSSYGYLVNDGNLQDYIDDVDRKISVHNADSNAHKSLFDAWLEDLFDAMYPIGSIYLTMSSDNPSTLFGGTWERIESRFLYGSINGQGVGTTGGEETHTLTVNEMPSHTHSTNKNTNSLMTMGGNADTTSGFQNGKLWGNTAKAYGNLTNTGGGQAHNNMPPYIMVNIWKRTA